MCLTFDSQSRTGSSLFPSLGRSSHTFIARYIKGSNVFDDQSGKHTIKNHFNFFIFNQFTSILQPVYSSSIYKRKKTPRSFAFLQCSQTCVKSVMFKQVCQYENTKLVAYTGTFIMCMCL